jgi:PAS domain S-box-containing protein
VTHSFDELNVIERLDNPSNRASILGALDQRRGSGMIKRADLAAAVEQAADGIVITDLAGKIRYVNPAFTAMTGYTTEAAVGGNPRILKSGRHSPTFYEELWSTIRSGRVWHGEIINRRKDGTLYNEEMQITPVLAANGEIGSYIAIKRDVTARRAAEEAQRLLASIVESSEDAIVACTSAGIILTWNRGAEAVFGHSSGEAIGKHVSMLLAPERFSGLARCMEQVLQGKTVSQYEGVGLHKDGRTVHISVTGSPIQNAASEIVAMSAVILDISERREAEQARGLLASIVESSEDAVQSVNLDGTILSWNSGAATLFGYSSQEIIGKNVATLLPAGRSGEVRDHIGMILQGRSISAFDTVRMAPLWFTRLHPTSRTPVNSILSVAVLVMLLILLSMLGVHEQEASQLLGMSLLRTSRCLPCPSSGAAHSAPRCPFGSSWLRATDLDQVW